MLDWIIFAITALLFLGGIVVLYIAVLGTYRFGFALNRIHAAAMSDTLAMSLFLIAIMLASHDVWMILKLLLVVAFAWCTSPVVAHMLLKLEYITDDRLSLYCELPDSHKKKEDK